MKIKHLFVLLIACFLSIATQAQITHTSSGNIDANAQKILDKAAQQFSGTSKSFSVTATSKNSSKQQVANQKVAVTYANNKYRAEMGSQVILCDGVAVYTINGETKEVTINPMSDRDDDMMNPGRLLSNWQKHFRAKYIRTEKDGTAVVDMTPKARASYYKVRLLIASSGVLKRMEMHNYDGSEMIFTINNFKSTKVSSDTFTYNSANYPKYEVIDMR